MTPGAYEEGDSGKQRDVIALLPSWGLGGGIEMCAEAVLEALSASGATATRFALLYRSEDVPTLRRKVAFVIRSLSRTRRSRHSETLLLVFHPSLVLPGFLLRLRLRGTAQSCKVFVHGAEIWGAGPLVAWLLRRSGMGLVAVSSFSAGAALKLGQSMLLPPSLAPQRYRAFRAVGAERAGDPSPPFRILSVFRMSAARGKGASVLLQAGDILRCKRNDFTVTLAGLGQPDRTMTRAVAERADWVDVVPSPSLEALTKLYAESDLFVLATRTRATRGDTSGEGFGIVLVEAQLAGLPVVPPASGGSADAFLPGLTGVRPADESAEALAATIESLLDDAAMLATLGRNAHVWADERFSPERYRMEVATALLGDGGPTALPLELGNTATSRGKRTFRA